MHAMRLIIFSLSLILSGCVQIYNYGNNNSTMISISAMGTATIPVQGLPSIP